MGMDGRQCFPGTLSTIACPARSIVSVHNLGQYVQPAKRPSPNADGETENHGGILHHLFVFGGPISARSTPGSCCGPLPSTRRPALEIALRTLLSETEHSAEHDAAAGLSEASSL